MHKTLPAADLERSCHDDLISLLDNVGRWLNKWINHQHTATADNGCAGVELAPWIEQSRTGGLNHPAAA
jgi:hypothetical protein